MSHAESGILGQTFIFSLAVYNLLIEKSVFNAKHDFTIAFVHLSRVNMGLSIPFGLSFRKSTARPCIIRNWTEIIFRLLTNMDKYNVNRINEPKLLHTAGRNAYYDSLVYASGGLIKKKSVYHFYYLTRVSLLWLHVVCAYIYIRIIRTHVFIVIITYLFTRSPTRNMIKASRHRRYYDVYITRSTIAERTREKDTVKWTRLGRDYSDGSRGREFGFL